MSNTRQIEIGGYTTFDFTPFDESDVFASEDIITQFLAMIAWPDSDIEIEYEAVGYFNNEWGGQTNMYRYIITGLVSFRYNRIEELVNALDKCGVVTSSTVNDLQNPQFGVWQVIDKTRTLKDWQTRILNTINGK